MREIVLKIFISLLCFPISFVISFVIIAIASSLWVPCFFVKLHERIVQIFRKEYESNACADIANMIMVIYVFGIICLIAPLSLFDFLDD
jgi:hypothetical protein